MQISRSISRHRGAKRAMALAVAGLALGSTIVGSSAAHADPKEYTAFVTGYGSDTTQDLFNGFGGFSNNNEFTPEIMSSVTTNSTHINSWDAFGTSCITPKPNGLSIARPAGSSSGRRMLSRAILGENFGNATCGLKSVSGMIDFARSSAAPDLVANPGTQLTYIPHAQDGLVFATYRANSLPVVAELTPADLFDIYTIGFKVVNGIRIVPCGIQTGSGTRGQWNTALGVTPAQETAAGNLGCNPGTDTTFTDDKIEENNGVQLKAKGDSNAMSNSAVVDAGNPVADNNCLAANPCQVIIGFSTGSFIAQNNGISPSTLVGTGVALGGITGVGVLPGGKSYSGSGTSLVPEATYYNSATFGRALWIVVDTLKVTASGNLGFKNLFIATASNPVPAICGSAALARAASFGFLPPAPAFPCGSTTTQGGHLSGAI